MMDDEILFVLLGLGYAVLPFLGLSAFLQVRGQRGRIEALERTVAGLQAALAAGPRPEAAAEPAPEPEPVATTAETVPEPDHVPPEAVLASEAAVPEPRPGLESRLTGRWLIWIGGVALALGGAFLVQVSIETGLLSPSLRILLGLALAVGLVAVAERLRRRTPAQGIGPLGADHLAPSAAGAGIAVAYAAVYAAHGLYGLIAQFSAFVGLACVSLVAVGLGLLHGAPVAALGIAGALAVPLVVGGDSADVTGLFLYLCAITAVAGLVARWRGWSWAVLLAHGGAVVWLLLWLVDRSGDSTPWIGAFLLLASTALALGLRRHDAGGAGLLGRWVDGTGLGLAAVTLAGGAALLLGRSEGALAVALTAGLGLALLADDRAGGRHTGGGVAAVLLAIVASLVFEGDGGLILFAGGTAAALVAAGFVLAHGSDRAGWFGFVGTAGPLLLLVIDYGLETDGNADPAWAALALGIAALHVALAALAGRHRDHAPWAGLLAAQATGALAAVAVGAVFLLRDAWLSTALALTVAGASHVHRHVPVRGLRWVSLGLAAAVVVRLSLNPLVLTYHDGGPLGGFWIWPGYGLAALAFLAARRGFGEAAGPWLRSVLEAGALSFVVVLVSLQIRMLADDGPLDRPGYDLLEAGLNSAWWLGMALFLYVRGDQSVPTVRWGWRVLGAMATVQVLFGAVVALNPLVTGDPVGGLFLVNLVTLAYGVPAVLAVAFAVAARRRGAVRLPRWAGAAALGLAWLWLTLTVRHAFHGSRLDLGSDTDAELYAYSVAWLAFGAALLAAGLLRGSLVLRYASLLVILVSVAKVFLIDMAALTGLWRAVSFIGLGAALLGIGFVYQRFVLLRPPPAASPPAGPPPAGPPPAGPPTAEPPPAPGE